MWGSVRIHGDRSDVLLLSSPSSSRVAEALSAQTTARYCRQMQRKCVFRCFYTRVCRHCSNLWSDWRNASVTFIYVEWHPLRRVRVPLLSPPPHSKCGFWWLLKSTLNLSLLQCSAFFINFYLSDNYKCLFSSSPALEGSSGWQRSPH